MKITYIIPNPEKIGGVSRSIKRVTDQLQKKGVDISMFCPDFEAMKGIVKPDMIIIRELLTGTQMQDWTQRTIDKLEEERPDLVVGYFGTSTGYCAVAAAKYLDIPVIVSLRGSDLNRDFFSSLHAHKLDFIAKNATSITTVSSEMKHKVKSWMNAEATFIPNSVDKGIFYPRSNKAEIKKALGLSDQKVVALLGEFKPSRGLRLLKDLKDELKDVQTIIIGKVRPETVKEIPNWIKVIPYIDNIDKLVEAYSVCDLVLQPSKYDGMPNVLLEAMACERTVLASPVGGIKDLIEHGVNGYLCKTNDDWKNTIKLALANESPEMGRHARATLTEPKQEAESFLNLFHTIVNKDVLLQIAKHESA